MALRRIAILCSLDSDTPPHPVPPLLRLLSHGVVDELDVPFPLFHHRVIFHCKFFLMTSSHRSAVLAAASGSSGGCLGLPRCRPLLLLVGRSPRRRSLGRPRSARPRSLGDCSSAIAEGVVVVDLHGLALDLARARLHHCLPPPPPMRPVAWSSTLSTAVTRHKNGDDG